VFDVCFGDSALSNPIVTGGLVNNYSYNWTSLPAGFYSTEKNPYLQPLADVVRYIFTVSDGMDTETDTIIVNRRALPTARSIDGASIVCKNQAGVIYSASEMGTNEHYCWNISHGGGTIINGKNTNKMVVNWGSIPGSYPLELSTFSRYGCKSSAEVNIEVNTTIAPQASYVEQKSPGSTILIASDEGATSYLWGYYDKLQEDDIIISGSTGRYCQMPHLDIE